MQRNPLVRQLILLALEEDLSGGDITSQLTIDARLTGQAEVLARQTLTVCGLFLLEEVCEQAGMKLEVELLAKEGNSAAEGDVLARLSGSIAEILAIERVCLNFLQRTCGVATHTRTIVGQLPVDAALLLDTRKTIPGWRILDKYAVRTGGGVNHRLTLGDMILVKDNHIAACGGSIANALSRVFAAKPSYMPVEVEISNLTELSDALKFDVDVVMLDNMRGEELGEAVALTRERAPHVKIEVSGGVRADQLSAIVKAGVDTVSMGALTHSAPAVDIALEVRDERPV